MRKIFLSIFTCCFIVSTNAQAPRTYTSSEILLQLKKLNVLGSVLYIAAHPDDENTRLLAYLANEKLYRTGYLSLTRGDGGQNLIGDEQGVDLGLMRTQELLSARRIDGAEQFFSRAFDFGYSKNPEEAMRIWDHDKILSDVVWIIRKFKPDVIITRFSTITSEGQHGHHTASAILAGEAFDAAADPTKFPEQLQQGVTVWQAKRLLWNTYTFGTTNTTSEDQFKLDCGDFNPVLGKSYGEIAATSRSQHKSQGFGVPAQRGSVLEYFKTIKGDAPQGDLMSGVNVSWDRTLFGGALLGRPVKEDNAQNLIDSIVKTFSIEHPENSVPALVRLYTKVESTSDAYWRDQKLEEIKKLIENCSGLFVEATTTTEYAVRGDSLKINFVVNNRLGSNVSNAAVKVNNNMINLDQPKRNQNSSKQYAMLIPADEKLTQPYWLEYPKLKGSFDVHDQQLIGKGENDPLSVVFDLTVEGKVFNFTKPIRYKYTDPVKGELYEPLVVINPVFISTDPSLLIFKTSNKHEKKNISFTIQANKTIADDVTLNYNYGDSISTIVNSYLQINKGEKKTFSRLISSNGTAINTTESINGLFSQKQLAEKQFTSLRKINYDHIPDINYSYVDAIKVVNIDLKTEGDYVGYIPGAGDKIPEALEQMGYKVAILKESDLTAGNLRQFDAIVTGVRAYNTNEWLSNGYDALMDYVKEGGVLLVQYNTNNSIGPVKAKISPYPFVISRNRITDEEAKVNFLLPEHKALNYPNKITEKDFDGWIQERSIYNAENVDSNYQHILSMKDPGENDQDGSLIIADYGKGRFVYTGLVFFRELPAGVPGAYRLFANLIANKRMKYLK